MATTTFTTDEQAGIERFRASVGTATRRQMETSLASLLPGGGAERMAGAPRREVLDEMARILREALAPAATGVAPAAAPTRDHADPAA
jgi:hypothetical protein